jgi:hypothetical protein
VRALLVAAGLLVLTGVGSADAAKPTAYTLRKSGSGPITAVAQDNGVAAWFTSFTVQHPGCDLVHLAGPGKHDRTLPQAASTSMTCNWDLSEGQPQLAVAARLLTALWTLHENGPSPFDLVIGASFTGPEQQFDRFAHASDGTGKWLGGVAGAGQTLAYSWADVEYVNPTKCLSTGSPGACRKKIADGGIKIVTQTPGTPPTDTPLPDAQPALQLAASAGRIAYIPAAIFHGNRPAPSNNSPVSMVDDVSGNLVCRASVHGVPAAIALSPHLLAVLSQNGGGRTVGVHDTIAWYSPTDCSKRGSISINLRAALQIAANDRLIVYRIGRQLLSVAVANKHITKLAKTAHGPVGLSLARGRLVWAENHGDTGRLRALAVRS